jgi:C4-dicarboxylate transporter DctM subunit
VQGGLPMTCVLTCMIFAAVSGSSVATTFRHRRHPDPGADQARLPGRPSRPRCRPPGRTGRDHPAVDPDDPVWRVAEVSIGELFIAGFGPGLLIGRALMLFVWIWSKIKGWGKDDGDGRLPFGTAIREGGLALLMPVIILGGIYGGIFTPTEASVVAVFYALVVGMFIYREILGRPGAIIFKKSVVSQRGDHVHHRQRRAVQPS